MSIAGVIDVADRPFPGNSSLMQQGNPVGDLESAGDILGNRQGRTMKLVDGGLASDD